MTTATKLMPKIRALAPWYGGNRMLAEHVGKALDGCNWVGIPFAGGMCEIGFITARTILANDLHRGVIALADYLRSDLTEAQQFLRGQLFHPDTLAAAQEELASGEITNHTAIAFFVVAWMTRSGTAGTGGEANGKLALRWEAGGGDSVVRYHNAIEALPHWADEFRRCQFSCEDCFRFLKKCKDRDRHGIYCDPPFPGPKGAKYTHKFSTDDHRRLAATLSEYRHARVVCRYHDHPLIRELYPDGDGWRWTYLEGRNQANGKTPEVLVVNDPARPSS